MAPEREEKDRRDQAEVEASAGQAGTEMLEEKYGPDAMHELGGRAPETAASTYTSTDLEEAEEEAAEEWGAERPRKGSDTVEDVLGEARESQGHE